MIAFRCDEHSVVFDIHHHVIFKMKEDTAQLDIEIWGKTLTLTPKRCLLNGKPFGEVINATDNSIGVELPNGVGIHAVFDRNFVNVGVYRSGAVLPSEAVVIEKVSGSWGIVTTDAYELCDILMGVSVSPAFLSV